MSSAWSRNAASAAWISHSGPAENWYKRLRFILQCDTCDRRVMNNPENHKHLSVARRGLWKICRPQKMSPCGLLLEFLQHTSALDGVVIHHWRKSMKAHLYVHSWFTLNLNAIALNKKRGVRWRSGVPYNMDQTATSVWAAVRVM